ncbi:hypothetical protein [Rhodococcus sp. KBS0724]|uniref:hypothetical protein n=1 Tax=Rhodococcus sp. KBS0724 TaxID=1179674 RepID=UPI0021B09987|nr:hypothetical protein [Rhodococcus sp. KBS0724]
MPGGFPVFRLYRDSSGSHVLCCARFSEFSGWVADEEISAQRELDNTVDSILREASLIPEAFTLVGEQQGYPVGDRLFDSTVPRSGSVSYAFQQAGAPWIVLGLDVSTEEFWAEVEDDDDLEALGPLSPLTTVTAVILTAPGWTHHDDVRSL